MALTLKDLLQAQEDLRQREEAQAAAPAESLSMAQLKELVVAQGSDKKESKSDKSLVKIFQEVKRQTKLLEQLVNISKDQSVLNNRENMQENRRLMERIADSLENIERTGNEPTPEKKTGDGIGLGGIATTLALALGGLVGVIQGYVKGLKTVASGLYKGLVWVSDFFPSLKKAMFNVEATFLLGFDLIKDSFKTFGSKLVRVLDSAIDSLKGFFSFEGKLGGMSKVFDTIKTSITNFIEPIAKAFNDIKTASAPIGKAVAVIEESISGMINFFKGLGSKLSLFKKLFSAGATIMKTIVAPITIIMTVFDTVMNVIDRFKSDGIIGGLVGVVEGLFNSIIAAPADLLKSAVSWILGAFGFDKAEQFLDSFSFVDIVKSFVDAILSPVETLKSIFSGVLDGIQQIHIPEIGFTIPIIDKKVSIGPFYPFKSDSTAPASAPAGAATAPAATPAPTAGTKEGYEASYNKAVADGHAPFAAKQIADKEHGLTGTGLSGSTLPSSESVKKPGPELGTAPVLVGGGVVNNNAASAVSNTTETNNTSNITRQSYEAIYNKHISAGRAPFAAKMLADKETGLTGTGASPVTLPSAIGKAPTAEAASVYDQSAQNAEAAIPSQSQQSTVVAPTTNISNTTQNQVIRMPVRNTDTSVMDYFKSRYA